MMDDANAAITNKGNSVTVNVTCTELKTIIVGGVAMYVATMQYNNWQGANSFLINSTTAFKFVVGQTYTMTIA